jgi:hypothetical protein
MLHVYHFPRLLIWALTFPGVMARLHLKAWLCRRLGYRVTKVVAFQYEEDRPGYIENEDIRDVRHLMVIQAGSGFLCALLGCLIAAAGKLSALTLAHHYVTLGAEACLSAPAFYVGGSMATYLWMLPDEDFPRDAIRNDLLMDDLDKALCLGAGYFQHFGTFLGRILLLDVLGGLILASGAQALVASLF